MPPRPALTDPDVEPSDAVVREHLGASAPGWDALFDRLDAELPDVRREWRYYRDGNAWLLKLTRAKRTVGWVSVHRGGFRLSASFPARAESAVLRSDLPERCKQQFLESASERMRGVTVTFPGEDDVQAAMALVVLRAGFR